MAKIVLDTVTGGYDLSVINNNFDKIEAEFQNKVLYRNNPIGEANTLETDTDVNGKRIYNLPEPLLDSEAARLQDIQNAVAGGAANLVSFTPYGHVSGNNLQAAVQELIDDTTNNGVSLPLFLKDYNAFVVENISQLKAVDKTKFTKVIVLGYYTKGDGGGGVYWYDSSDTVSTDNGGSLIVATDNGRWKLIRTTVINAKQFGAKGDSTTDDTARLQAFVDFLAVSGIKGYIPTGRYKISSRVTISGSCEIYGDGWQDVRDYTGPTTRDWTQAFVRGTIIYISHQAATDAYGFYVTGNDVTIRDMEFETNQGNPASVGWTPNVAPWCIYCFRQTFYEFGANTVTINNIMLRNAYNGIGMLGVARGHIDGIYGQVLRTGISVTQNMDVLRIENIHFNWHFWTSDTDVLTYIKGNSEAIKLGRVDNPILTNIFVFQGRAGISTFVDTDPTSGGVTERLQGTNLGFDDIFEGILCVDSITMDLSNIYVYCDSTIVNSRAIHCAVGIGTGYSIKLNISNADFQGSYSEAILLFSAGEASFSNVRIRSWNQGNMGGAAIRTDKANVRISNLLVDETQGNGAAVFAENSPGTISGFYDSQKGNMFSFRTFVGTCNGTGEANITHGIVNLQLYGLLMQCWYKSAGDGAMLPMALSFANATDAKFTGGVSGQAYRATVVYSPTLIGGW